ncbi:MAG: hypothetical protein AAGA60_02315 [Cyanobacteria bacterium P01_E01_bin.42]
MTSYRLPPEKEMHARGIVTSHQFFTSPPAPDASPAPDAFLAPDAPEASHL